MILIEKQGAVVRAISSTPITPPQTRPSKRGQISTFSRKSRRRLIDLFARMDTSNVRKTFLTLTFAFPVPPSWAKKSLKRFIARLTYHYPKVTGFWRVEPQKRRAPHYHLILFNLPYVQQAILQDVWTECTQEKRSIVHVTLIRSHKGVMSYVSKYIAKVDSENSNTSLDNAPYQQNSPQWWSGRHWGVINAEALPMAQRFVGIITDEEVAGYFWSMASLKITRPSDFRRNTTRIYSSEAHEIYLWCLRHGGFDCGDVWEEMLELKELGRRTKAKMREFFFGATKHH